ncbi:Type II secretion system (T2SS), protein F [Candidatus Gugararchaeum adminiculabundum]|nr:Type II secretion system (T2SS), protein F [Candidatus Gugararchaeum adminiculabundum]
MQTIEILVKNFAPRAFAGAASAKRKDGLRIDLLRAGLTISADDYCSFALFSCLLILILSLFFCFLVLSSDALNSFAYSILAGAVAYFVLLLLPKHLACRKALQAEAELPVILRTIAVELGMKVPYEKTLEHIAHADYFLSQDFAAAVKEIKSGASIPEALVSLSERIDSRIFARSINQMIVSYEQGSRPEALKNLAEELMDAQKNSSKNYAAQSALTGLMFLPCSCIVPALYFAYLIVTAALSNEFSAKNVWIAYVLVFPLFNILMIAYLSMKIPPFLLLRKKHLKLAIEAKFIFASLLLFCAILGAGIALNANALPLAVASLSLPIVYALLQEYSADSRNARIEQCLPDALMHAASLQKSASFEKVVKSMAGAGYGELSDELAITSKQLSSNAHVGQALEDLSSRNDSVLLDRMAKLLMLGYSTGAETYTALRETADDILSIFSVVRERQSALAIQKYTIILGGAILVPLILGSILNLFSGMGLGLASISGEAVAVQKPPIAETGAMAMAAYLLIFSVLSSLMIAVQEGQIRKFVIYLLLLAPISFLIFSFAQGHRFI